MRRPVSIAPPKGKLGVLTPGMGAVSTTFMAGVELVRRGIAPPVGSLTQMGTDPPRQAHRKSRPEHQRLRSARADSTTWFSAAGIFSPTTPIEAAHKRGVLEQQHLAKVEKFLEGIQPDEGRLRSRITSKISTARTSKRPKTNSISPSRSATTSAASRRNPSASRLVMVWCGSTEVFLKPHAVHKIAERFRSAP